MTNDRHSLHDGNSFEQPSDDEMAALEELFARATASPDSLSDLWASTPPWLEDSIVEAIAAEVTEASRREAEGPTNVTSLTDHRTRRASTRWLASAAAAVLIVGGVAMFATRSDPGDSGIEFAMSGTEAAPGASASVELFVRPAGLRILLDTEGLAPAPPDFFYEAWITDGTRRVSAGTFHLRGGHGQIELWAGVADPTFNVITVTLEPLDGVADSSGDVRMSGTFELTD